MLLRDARLQGFGEADVASVSAGASGQLTIASDQNTKTVLTTSGILANCKDLKEESLMSNENMFFTLFGLSLLLSPVLGFFAYWVFLLMKLGWGWGEFVRNYVLAMF